MLRPILLVVVENMITRRTIRVTAESNGFDVAEVADFEQAIQRAARGGVEAAVVDLPAATPEVFAAAGRLRAAIGPLAPLAGIAGPLSQQQAASARACGVTDLLPKPLEPSRLVEVLRRTSGGRSAVSTRFRRARYVLVADPSKEEAARLRQALQAAGLEADAVHDGRAALESARRDPPDAVVASLMLPTVDGLRLCAELKRDARFVSTPIVLVSSFGVDDEERARARAVGAHAIATRSSDLAPLVALVAEATRAARRAAPAVLPDDVERAGGLVRQQLEESHKINVDLTRRVALHEAGLSILAGLAEALDQATNVDATLDRLLHQGLDAAGISKGAAYLRDPDGKLALRSQVGWKSAGLDALLGFFGRTDLLHTAIEQGVVIRVPAEESVTPEERRWLEGVGARAVAIAPFGRPDRGAGVIVMASRSIEFGEDWLAFARGCAGLIGQALELARALARRERVARQQATIAELGRSALASADLQRVLDEAAAATVRALDVDLCGVYIEETDRRALLLMAGAGWKPGVVGRLRATTGPSTLPGLAASTHERVLSAELAAESRFGPCEEALGHGARSAAAVPLVGERGPLGAIVVYARRRGAFAEEEATFLEGVAGTIASAVARRSRDEALRRSEERFRRLADSIGEVFWLAEPDLRRLAYLSPAFETLFGAPGECAFDYPGAFLARVHPEDVETATRLFALADAKGEEVFRVLRPNGSLRWVRARVYPARGAPGEPRRVSGIASDITELKEAELALAESDERLRHSQKLDAIGRLAGGVAHDFNNLLTGITGYCDLLLVSLAPGDPARGDVDEIRKAATRASTLARQLLAFSRKQAAAPRVLDLNEVVSGLEKMLRRLIGEDIELLTTLETALGTVNADQSQLEQVIVNLCVNARDAMPSGGKITIETQNVELDGDYARRHIGVTPGSYVLLSVADTGHGMSKEVLSRIFEPFFTTKPQGKGTGLGLSTVYGIVKQSGGNVWVYSEVGRGSTFKVYLPRVDLPREEAGAGRAPAEEDALLRGTESILLAEDDDLVRDLTTRILRKAGYRVVEASRGHQALEAAAAQKEPFDLLVTDVIMPELSGRELARALCAERPALKVLYTSGYSSDHISGELEEHPDEAFLQKPFSARTLLSAVRETIERRRPGP